MKARDKLILANRGLVGHIAKQFRHRSSLLWEDLVGEGMVGLCIAADKFDPKRGTQFGTYAGFWVRACILKAVTENWCQPKINRTKEHNKVRMRYHRARAKLEQTGNEPTRAEIAHELGVSEKLLESMIPQLTGQDRSMQDPIHVERNSVYGAQRTFGETVADPSPSAEDIVCRKDEFIKRRALVHRAFTKLPEREQKVLARRAKGETLAVIGRDHRISRERVRQLENHAVEQISKHVGRNNG